MPYKLGLGSRQKNFERKKSAAAKKRKAERISQTQQSSSVPVLAVDVNSSIPPTNPTPVLAVDANSSIPPTNPTSVTDSFHQNGNNTETTHHLTSSQPFPLYTLPYKVIVDGIAQCCLPTGWIQHSSDVFTKLCKIESNPDNSTIIPKEITIWTTLEWTATIYGKNCTSSKALQNFPSTVTGLSMVLNLIDVIHNCTLCIGSPEEKFHRVANVRNGVFLSHGRNGNVTGQRHGVTVINRKGERFDSTIRSTHCEFLMYGEKERCSSCWVFRNTLYSLLNYDSKIKKTRTQEERIDHRSRAPLCTLPPAELYSRTKNIIKAKRSVGVSEFRLRQKLHTSIKEDGVILDEDTSSSIHNLARDCESAVMMECEEGSFQQLFWKEQMKAISCKDKRGMRWHPMFIKWCLNIKLRSTAAYRAMKDSGVILLPNERTLLDYTHWTKSGTDFTGDVIDQLYRETNFSELEDHQKYVVLLHDEVKIKEDLVFDKSSGELIGFVDVGHFNNDLAEFEKEMKGGNRENVIAKYMLVFMVRGITIRLNYPLAHFPTDSITSDFLFPLIWEAVESLEMAGFKVLASTSDGASANRRFYALHKNTTDAPVTYKTDNPFAEDDRDIYFFSDVPHLLKTTRNCWANSGSHNKKRLLWNGEHIVWKTVEDMYKADLERGGLFLCHKLKYEHVYLTSFAKMKVKYAAQVLSTTVANAVELYGRNGSQQQLMPTVEFIRMFDKFFDCMNVRSFREGHNKRKPNLLPYRSPEDPRLQWLAHDFLGYLTEWSERVDARQDVTKSDKQRLKLSRQTLQGIYMTVNSFVDVTKYLLQQPGVVCVLSEKFNQDPLESYFGNQRQMKGGNDAPTVSQFYHNANSLRLKSSSLLRVKGANVHGPVAESRINNTPLPKRR